MKIAVAALGKNVAGHFGHCENFIFFDTADGGITGVNSVPNPGPAPEGHPDLRPAVRGGGDGDCVFDPVLQ